MSIIHKACTSILLAASSIATISNVYANTANNSIYLELGGNAAVYSINYERNFDRDWGLRLGLGALWASKYAGVAIPVLVNKYWGNEDSNHKFETGIGATYFAGSDDKSKIFDHHYKHSHDLLAGTASIGYRYLPKTKGMTYKVAFTPFLSSTFIPWVGFSVGHTF